MKKSVQIVLSLVLCVAAGCQSTSKKAEEFPAEIVRFKPFEKNPVFSGTNTMSWDKNIRERGYIMMDQGIYKMWYTGYMGKETDTKYLGYATSTDGIAWTRFGDTPIFDAKWTEDIFVIKYEEQYYMYAEGVNDVAHLLTSTDGIGWVEKGDLIIRQTSGDTIPAPYGTPSVWIEEGKWYLFYERNDLGIWMATSDDQITWTNIQDEPVIRMGPGAYDSGAVASNQVIKYKGRYYIYYHGSTNPNWADQHSNTLWSSNVAMSTDLIHWKKYPENPIVEGDHSSPILVFDGNKYRLYTMHDKVWMYLPR